MSQILKLGKKTPPSHHPLPFARYFDLDKLPTPPAVFGNTSLITNWGMLGNDQYGDCVEAGGPHQVMYMEKDAGNPQSTFTTATSLSDYSAVTGFNPNDPNSDQGTDMADYAAYFKSPGLIDVAGHRHVVDGYVALAPGNIQELMTAAYIFGGAGFGFAFPQSAMDQFNAGHPWTWTYVAHSPIVGGHYVYVYGRNSAGQIVLVTWGKTWTMGTGFARYYNDETLVYLSMEWLKNNMTPSQCNLAQLEADMKALPSVTPQIIGPPVKAKPKVLKAKPHHQAHKG
jgi:hypothetical protein